MSEWTHLVCFACWNAANPQQPADGNDFAAKVGDETMQCCKCGTYTLSTIYVRTHPKNTVCDSQGKAHPT